MYLNVNQLTTRVIKNDSMYANDLSKPILEKTNTIGRNLKKGILMYFITAFITTFLLFVLVAVVLSGIV